MLSTIRIFKTSLQFFQSEALRRAYSCCLLAVAACTLLPHDSLAKDSYPDRPIVIVVPFAPGGTIDWIARSVSAQLSERLGQQVIIENKPGANGVIGTQQVARSRADGYSLLLVTGSFAVNPSIYNNLTYDAKKDFIPITSFAKGTGMLVLVNPSLPVHNVNELVTLSRQKGKYLNYSSPGVGNTIHLATELFKEQTGADISHVPYKGSAPALNALVGNQVQVMIVPPPLAMPFVQDGRLRAIAFTGTDRFSDLPQVPTLQELGFEMHGFDQSWIGLFAPSGTPDPIISRLYSELHNILSDPKERIAFDNNAPGYIPDGRTPKEFSAQVLSDMKSYSRIVRIANVSSEP